MSVVATSGLGRRYHRGPETVTALVDVTITLVPGELVALVGPSGSGKTTLLNCIAGWEHPDDGAIAWRGRPASAETLAALGWEELAIVPQGLGVMDELTVSENVDLPARLADTDPADLSALLEGLGLSDLADRRPDELSLGERQRIAVGRALRRNPALLLADEPTGHQDAAWATRLLDLLHTACDAGMSCLAATHDAEVLDAAHRVIHLTDGRVTD